MCVRACVFQVHVWQLIDVHQVGGKAWAEYEEGGRRRGASLFTVSMLRCTATEHTRNTIRHVQQDRMQALIVIFATSREKEKRKTKREEDRHITKRTCLPEIISSLAFSFFVSRNSATSCDSSSSSISCRVIFANAFFISLVREGRRGEQKEEEKKKKKGRGSVCQDTFVYVDAPLQGYGMHHVQVMRISVCAFCMPRRREDTVGGSTPLFYIYLAHPVNYQDCDGVGHNGMAYGAQNRVVDNIPLGAWRHAGNAAHGILPRLKHTQSTL